MSAGAPAVADVLYVLHPYLADKNTGRGHDRYAYELIRHAKELGIQCATLDSGYIESMARALPAELLFPLRLRKATGRLYHATASVNARAPAWMGKRPLLTTIHDVIWYHTGSRYDAALKDFYKRYCIRLAAQKSDRVIVPFPSTAAFLVDQLKVSRDRIELIPYGISHEQFHPNPESMGGKRLDKSKEEQRVVFVGQLTRAKGVDTLIRAFSIVKAEVPAAKLHVCSGGWHEEYVRRIWMESDVRDAIVLKGHIPEEQLRAVYADADVTVFPSRYGFGLPTLESMACGTPAIAGSTLDALDFVQGDALLVDPEKIEDVAEKIVTLLTDADLYATLSQRGLKRAQAFSWRATAERTVQVYRQYLS